MGPTGVGVLLSILLATVLVIAASVFQVRVVNRGWIPGAKRDAFLTEKEAAEA